MQAVGINDEFAIGIIDHQVGIAADGNEPFPGVKVEQFGRAAGHGRDETVDGESICPDAVSIEDRQAGFNPSGSSWNGSEIISVPGFLLNCIGAMISGNGADSAGAKGLP